MLLAILPLAHVLLTLLKEIDPEAVREVLLVGTEIAVAVVESVHAVTLALGLLVLTNVVGTVSTLLHANTVADTVRPCALVKVSIVVSTNSVAAAVSR
jgi:hypothetical protein